MKPSLLGILMLIFCFSCTQSKHPIVEMNTAHGTIELEIYKDKAPITANHFLKNVDENVFNDACFYRVVRQDNQKHKTIKIEVVQGGLFHDSIVDQMPSIAHESTKETGILHKDGVISMARLEPGTASTEFFICVGDQPELDAGGKRNPDNAGFAAFGKVIKGMDIVKKIQQQKDNGQMLIERIPITSIKRK